MNTNTIIIIALIIGFIAFIYIKKQVKINSVKKIVMENNYLVVDVRTPEEYKSGHVNGSINMPLQSLQNTYKKLVGEKKTIIVCCASGVRSAQATSFLKSNGISNVVDGGPWTAVNGAI